MMESKNIKFCSKAFTLAELLTVVAIISVLVAFSIPILSNQIEKARESTDLANIRSAYSEVMVASLSDDAANTEKTIDLKQTLDGWSNNEYDSALKVIGEVYNNGLPEAKGTCLVYYDADHVVFKFSGIPVYNVDYSKPSSIGKNIMTAYNDALKKGAVPSANLKNGYRNIQALSTNDKLTVGGSSMLVKDYMFTDGINIDFDQIPAASKNISFYFDDDGNCLGFVYTNDNAYPQTYDLYSVNGTEARFRKGGSFSLYSEGVQWMNNPEAVSDL